MKGPAMTCQLSNFLFKSFHHLNVWSLNAQEVNLGSMFVIFCSSMLTVVNRVCFILCSLYQHIPLFLCHVSFFIGVASFSCCNRLSCMYMYIKNAIPGSSFVFRIVFKLSIIEHWLAGCNSCCLWRNCVDLSWCCSAAF